MQELLDAISDPTRRAALAVLWNDQEHCVCELMARLGATQSRMSRHMKVLRDAGLICGTIEGPATSYCLDDDTFRWLKQHVDNLL